MMHFDHEKLEVYKVSLEFVCFVSNTLSTLKGNHRHARDQLVRSSQSIPLNIAEGNGKRSFAERRRYFEIARGSAMESAANLDVLICCGACSTEEVEPGKALLIRIVSMLSRMTEPRENVAREDERDYGNGKAAFDYDYDYEHEHEGTGERYSP
jgi:four helix bundle protein